MEYYIACYGLYLMPGDRYFLTEVTFYSPMSRGDIACSTAFNNKYGANEINA